MDFDQWDDLFLSGCFAPRELLLRGLSSQQVSRVPVGASHSIYQELWHATTVLEMSLEHGRVALASWPHAEHFPSATAPADQGEWDALVARFLNTSHALVRLAHEPGRLAAKEPGYDMTWRDALEFLSVHTAYHLGRIVLLRQLVGSWPPSAVTPD